MAEHRPPSTAPGTLGQVQSLLNTERARHAERDVEDVLEQRLDDAAWWAERLPAVPRPRTVADVAALRLLRDDLRGALDGPLEEAVEAWLAAHPLRVAIEEGRVAHHAPADDPVAAVLVLVVDAVADGGWWRLKACPDCGRVFWDHSRNRSRVWCGMYAGGPDGRACGSIAKTRAYRARRRDAAQS